MNRNRKVAKWFLALVLMVSTLIPAQVFAATGDINSIHFDSDKEIVLTVGEDTEQLRVIAQIEGASDKDVTNDVTWSTSSSQIVTVSGGLLTPVAKGTATITAKYKNAIATKTVTVKYAYDEFKLNQADGTEYKIGTDDAAIKALADGTDVSGDAAWTTSDSNVVTVDKGELTFVSKGTATITASYKGMTANVKIKVVAAFDTLSIFIKGDDSSADADLEMLSGETSELQVKSTDKDGADPVDVSDKATWSSSDTSIATVDDSGKVTALKLGTTTITATYLGSSVQKAVYVRNPYEALILKDSDFVKNAVLFMSDGSKAVTAEVRNSIDNSLTVTADAKWESSNPLAVTVSAGVVTPRSPGTSTIHVSYLGASKDFTVTVYPTVTKFDIKTGDDDSSDLTVLKGDSKDVPTVTGTLLNEDEQDFTKAVVWKSSNEDVLKVDGTKLKGIESGTASITGTIGAETVTTLSITVSEKVLLLMPAKDSYQLVIGKTADLPSVNAVLQNGDEVDATSSIKWALSGSNAVIKDNTMKGLVKGNATLTGTYLNQTVKIPVSVEAEIVTMIIDPQTIELNLKKSKSINVKGYYANGSYVSLSSKMNWISSDLTVASITSSSVKANGIGSATLTGSYQGKTYTVKVSVVPKLTKLEVSEKKLYLSPGTSQAVTLKATYDTGDTAIVTANAVWTSSKTPVAKVTAGSITAVAKGSASIKAQYGGKSVTVSVSVK